MTFQVTRDTITPAVKRFGREFPKAVGDAGFEIAQRAERNLKRSIQRHNLMWTGRLLRSVQARRLSKFRSAVFIPKYGIQLAEMEGHYVSLKRGRNIVKWTKDKFGSKVKSGRSKVSRTKRGVWKGALYVTPTRWINRPLSDARRASVSIMNKHLRRVVR